MNCPRLLPISVSIFAAVLPPNRLHAQLAPNEQTARVMRLERFVVPEFPPFLRQAGVLQGTVVAAISSDSRGRAHDVLVLESTDARFTEAALEAIREWRFDARRAEASMDPVPVVRFLFTTGAVSMVPLTVGVSSGPRRTVRAETPIELPNFSHLDHVPAVLHSPAPEFPVALRDHISSGSVVVKYFVDATGRVRLPTVVSATSPELGAAALAAIRQWRYDPPRIDGKPVIALERHSFQFSAAR
jgi:TonB family protein